MNSLVAKSVKQIMEIDRQAHIVQTFSLMTRYISKFLPFHQFRS